MRACHQVFIINENVMMMIMMMGPLIHKRQLI